MKCLTSGVMAGSVSTKSDVRVPISHYSHALTRAAPGRDTTILDFTQENKSEVKPDTIHADTQG